MITQIFFLLPLSVEMARSRTLAHNTGVELPLVCWVSRKQRSALV